MKKIGRLFSLFILCLTLFVDTVWAASFEVKVTSNSMTVGNSVTLSVKANNAAGKFTITSSNSSVVSVSAGSAWIDNTTQTFTLKGNKVGTAVITITAADVTGYGNEGVSGSKTVTITVKDKPKETVNPNPGNNSGNNNTVQVKPKSSNNFLTSLSVEGLTLEEKFDKEILEYSVNVPAETEKIRINAQLADSSAKVSGTGVVNVTTGLNTFNIVVTAENGSKRTYILKATVLELKPIEVTVDGAKYSVIRKRKELPEISEYFTEKDVKLGEDTVEGYYNEKLNYTLVGLKDSNGNIGYYIYKNNKYEPYREYSFNGTVLQLLDKKLDGGYKEVSFVYNNDKIISYQEVKTDIIKNTYALDNNDIIGNQFYLFYAKNVETGKEYLYQYDALEKTVQRYNLDVVNMYKHNSDTYYMYLLFSLLGIGILIVIISILLITNKKNKKARKRAEMALRQTKKKTKAKVDIEEE